MVMLAATPRTRRRTMLLFFSLIYECPECETRYLNEHRRPDCLLFTRRIGPGGTCPRCDEPVAQVDLI